MLNGPSSNSYVLGADGERALQIAAGIARRSEQPPAENAALILDLADWYLLSERPDKAATLYDDAARLLAAASPPVAAEHSPLAQPELLLFRPPPSARRNLARAREEVDEKVAILEYTVTAAGRVADLKFVEGDITDSQRDSLLGAFAKAIFRPRVVDGKPVDTPGQRHRQVYRTLKKEGGE